MNYVFIGIVSGIISGFGMGGGTVLILMLSIFLKINQHVAQATNLIFFMPTSIAATIINIKNKNIDSNLTIVTTISGILGVIIGTKLSVKIDVELLRKIFGIFLIIIIIYEIFVWFKEYKREKKRNIKKKGGSEK